VVVVVVDTIVLIIIIIIIVHIMRQQIKVMTMIGEDREKVSTEKKKFNFK
jgi:hypothetical protein